MRYLMTMIVLVALTQMTGCAGCQNQWKHIQSNVTGLSRKITLYNANGEPIREWTTQAKVEDEGGTCYFIANGKAVIISGTFVIEETE